MNAVVVATTDIATTPTETNGMSGVPPEKENGNGDDNHASSAGINNSNGNTAVADAIEDQTKGDPAG
jgi:hypothetical protein